MLSNATKLLCQHYNTPTCLLPAVTSHKLTDTHTTVSSMILLYHTEFIVSTNWHVMKIELYSDRSIGLVVYVHSPASAAAAVTTRHDVGLAIMAVYRLTRTLHRHRNYMIAWQSRIKLATHGGTQALLRSLNLQHLYIALPLSLLFPASVTTLIPSPCQLNHFKKWDCARKLFFFSLQYTQQT